MCVRQTHAEKEEECLNNYMWQGKRAGKREKIKRNSDANVGKKIKK